MFACETLMELSICSCRLELPGLRINLHSVRRLYLKQVHLDEHAIETLLPGIPLIQLFSLYFCKGLTNIKLANLDNLTVGF